MTVVGASPDPVSLVIYQGDDFRVRLETVDDNDAPVDITGATARAQIRATPPAVEILAEFAVTVGQTWLDLALTNEQTTVLPPSGGVWDVELDRGMIETIAAGRVSVIAEVTR